MCWNEGGWGGDGAGKVKLMTKNITCGEGGYGEIFWKWFFLKKIVELGKNDEL